ncbi:hypothetical protein [Ralstonia pseudosolanacearum]
MAPQLVFSSEKEKALHKINHTNQLFAAYLDNTKGKQVRHLRLFIYDQIPADSHPNCYQVRLDQAQQQPVQYSRPHVEFRKNFEGQQTYDQSMTKPGIYYYENLRYWGGKNFTYQKDNSGYFQIEANGEVKRILKSDVVKKLVEWEKEFGETLLNFQKEC